LAPKIIGGVNAPTPVGELGMSQMTQAIDLIDHDYEKVISFSSSQILICVFFSNEINTQDAAFFKCMFFFFANYFFLVSFICWCIMMTEVVFFSLCIVQIGRDMLMSGYIQPIPDLSPVIPSVEEIPSVDPDVSPYETNIVSFYKTWDIFGALSNFSPHPIRMPDENGDYVTWPTVEHYYQVLLHLLFSLFYM
jgi:hypothetical protein